jgi:glycogen operon protein
VEGPTDDPKVLELRARQQRNFLATLFLSQGVPMICHGDELGRTQQGNNNGFCQDNELTWIDWDNADDELLAFTQVVSELRRKHPTFRRRRFFEGRPVRGKDGASLPDIAWLRPDGSVMTEDDWGSGFGRAVAVFLNGAGILGSDDRGERVVDDSFLLCFSADDTDLEFIVPDGAVANEWEVVLDTALAEIIDAKPVQAGDTVTVLPRTLVVLRRTG